jgi:hypothetical protein
MIMRRKERVESPLNFMVKPRKLRVRREIDKIRDEDHWIN